MALIATLVLLPLGLACVSVLAGTFLVLRAHARNLHLCRTELLETQEALMRRLDHLMRLNPEAGRLRALRAEADQAMAAAIASGVPAAIAGARAQQAAVMALQIELRSRQQGHLTRAGTEGETRIAKLRTRLQKATGRARDIAGSSVLSWTAASSRPRLAVTALPPSSLTPDHVPSAGFARKQAILVSWSFRPAALVPSWLALPREVSSFRLQSGCAATAEFRGEKWFVRLTEAKRL